MSLVGIAYDIYIQLMLLNCVFEEKNVKKVEAKSL